MRSLLLCALSTFAWAHRLRKCQRDNDLIFMNNFYITPGSFGPGHHVKLHLDLDNNYAPIYDGFVQYTILHDNQEYYPQVDSLCEFTSCPIYKGDIIMEIPIEIPLYDEDIDMRIELYDRNMTSFVCLNLSLRTSLWSKIINFITPGPEEPVRNLGKCNLRGRQEIIEPIIEERTLNTTYNASLIEYLNRAPIPIPAPLPKAA